MANADIELLFGVRGGGEISKGSSGELIKNQLSSIVEKINATPFEIKFKADEASIKTIKEQISKAVGTINIAVKTASSSSGGKSSGSSDDTTQKLGSVSSALSKLETLRHTLSTTRSTISSLGDVPGFSSDFIAKINETSKAISQLNAQVESSELTQKEFSERYGEAALAVQRVSNEVKEFKSVLSAEAKEAGAGGGQAEKRIVDMTDALNKLETLRHKLSTAESKLGTLNGNESSLQYVGEGGSLTLATSSVSALEKAVKDASITQDEFNKKYSETRFEVNKTANSVSEYVAEMKAAKSQTNEMAMSADEMRVANNQITKSIEEVSAARKKYGALGLKAGHENDLKALNNYDVQLSILGEQLKKGSISQNEFNMRLSEIREGVTNATSSLSQYGLRVGSLSEQFNKLGDITKQALGLYSMHAVVTKGISLIKSMINNAVELETAFADTRIVTHSTTEELKAFGVEITQISNDTAASIESLVSATTTFARLGYSLEESTALAKYTGMLEKVGNVDSQRAEDAITSIIKAFPDGVTVENIESAMDKLVQTGNNFPISVDQIAESMTNASSALAATGNSFEQAVALVTAANTTVQNASKASTALRTISARIRKTDAELNDLGEVMTTAKHQEMIQALSDYNVSLVDINGEYRSTYDIMKDIAAQWHNMTTMEQAALAELVAGTRQQVVFYSIVEHFDEAANAMEAMSQSAGALSDSYEIYLGTSAAQLERFDIAWKTFSMDFVNGSTLKGIINIGTGLLNIADRLQRLHLLIPTIIAAITAIKGLKFAKSLSDANAAVDVLVKSMIQTGTVTEGLKQDFLALTSVQRQKVVSDLAAAKSAGVAGAETAMLSMQAQALATSEQAAGISAAQTGAEIGAMAATEGAATVATDALSFSLKGLFASNPLGFIALIGSVVVSAISAISSVVRKSEEAKTSIEDVKQSLSDLANSSQQTASSMQSMNDQANEIIPRFVELRQKMDDLGNRTAKMTDEEYAEFVSLSNQLAELFPELKIGMDENGNAMLNLSGNADQLADSLYRVLDAQNTLARAEIAGNMDDAISAAKGVEDFYHPEALTGLDSFVEEMSKEFGGRAMAISEYLDSIAKISPEINDVINKLGKEDINGDIRYTILGNGSMYSSEEEFFKEIDGIIAKTKERVKADLDVEDAQSTIAWGYVMQSATAWLQNQPAYKDASAVAQDIIEGILQDIDLSSLDIQNGSDLQTYLYTNVLKPINDMSAETQGSVGRFTNAMSSFSNGRSSVREMKSALEGVTKSLKNSGMEASMVQSVLESIGASDLSQKIDVVSSSIKGESDAVQEFVESLSASDLEKVYQLLTMDTSGEMSLDAVIDRLQKVKVVADEASKSIEEVLDLTDFLDKLQGTAKNIDSVVSSMKKLREGTALTTEEVIKLASEYPELMKNSTLFTDTSIKGQEKLLNAVIESNKKQYEATVQSQIAQLEAGLKRIEIESAANLFSALGWSKTQAIYNDPDIPAAAKEEMIDAAKYQTSVRIQNEIDNIRKFGSNMIDLALSALNDIDGPSSSSYNGSSSYGGGGSSSSSSSSNPVADWVRDRKYTASIGADPKDYDIAKYLSELAEVIRHNIDAGNVTELEVRTYIEELVKGIKDLESNVKKTIDNLVSYRLKMLQDIKKKEKKDLEDRLDELKKFYDEQKALLKDQADEEKYLEEQAEKRRKVSDIQTSMDQIRLDNSAWAQKRMAELSAELSEAQKELTDFEKERALETATDFLDKQYDEQAANIQKEIDGIDAILNDPNTLYNKALADIQSSSADIYKEIKEYGKNNKNNGVNEALSKLDDAAEAIRLFNEYIDLNKNRVYSYAGRYVPGSNGANKIEWVIEDGYIIPRITKGGYAGGTSNATSGIHRIDEFGTETIFTASNGNKYRIFSRGDKVLTSEASSFLYEFARTKGRNISSLADGIDGRSMQDKVKTGAVAIKTGDIIINGNADERTVSEIRRAQRETVEMILRELTRLQR